MLSGDPPLDQTEEQLAKDLSHADPKPTVLTNANKLTTTRRSLVCVQQMP
jgi:hypothetical protein